MISIKSISERCGVSMSTVSKALNGRSDVSVETREHVRRIAMELGYLPNSAARTLRTNRSYSIGVLFVDKTASGLAHEYFSAVLGSLQKTVGRWGYDITFIGRDLGLSRMSYREHCHCRGFDGIVVVCADFADPDVIQLVDSGFPVVTIDHSFTRRASVLSDNEGGVRELVTYIRKRGHEKIAFIHGEDTVVTQSRLDGFRKTCLELGVKIPDEYVRPALYHDPKSVMPVTRALLTLPDRPTCIMYPDDYSFLGGKAVIEEFGLSIPGDVSVTGYDGIFLSQILTPKLTTLKQDTIALGEKAGRILIELIEQPDQTVPERYLVAGRLIEGASVQKLSRGGT